jgi:quercetin dioxygenase-like cupin family protein
MRKLLIMAAVTAVVGGGVAVAGHVTTLDPATVPTGFFVAHNRIADVPVSAFARAYAADGAEVTVQHIRLAPNQGIPWHTHPGPVFVLMAKGAFIYEYAQGSKCISVTYTAGEGFVDPGFGHVHQATAGPEGAEIYAVYVLPPGSENHLIPITGDPPTACSP